MVEKLPSLFTNTEGPGTVFPSQVELLVGRLAVVPPGVPHWRMMILAYGAKYLLGPTVTVMT